jgi:hypothetical protein
MTAGSDPYFITPECSHCMSTPGYPGGFRGQENPFPLPGKRNVWSAEGKNRTVTSLFPSS